MEEAWVGKVLVTLWQVAIPTHFSVFKVKKPSL